MRVKLFVLGLNLCVLCLFIGSAVATEMEVLTVRLEKLPLLTGQSQNDGIRRDPFNWSTDFIEQFTPMLKKGEQPVVFAGLTLQSIIWDQEHPQAIVNSQLVSVGDQVNGILVNVIEKDYVIMEKNGYKHPLEFAVSFYDFTQN